MSPANSGLERIALWIAHSKKCIYCGDLIQLRDLEIDHILPKSLANDPVKLATLMSELSLPRGFNLNSARNYLPTHRGCNSKKSGRVLQPSNIRYYLEIADGKLGALQRHIDELELQAQRDVLIGSVRASLESGNLDPLDLAEAISNVQGFRLSTEIEFADGKLESHALLREVEALLDRPILFAKTESIDGIEFEKCSGETAIVRTCREYRSAKADGYYAATTFAMKMEAYVAAANAILDVASRAKVPVTSFVSMPHVGVADLALLPPSVLPEVSPDDREKIESFGKASLEELLQKDEISVLSVSSNRLNIKFGGFGMALMELMRTDLDSDGIEEILVQHYTYAIGGTLGASSIGVLRRRSPNVPFEYGGLTTLSE